jgi:hypothetical protein
MVPALLGRELGTSLSRDPVAEYGLLALELARLVSGVHPVRNLGGISGLGI